MSNLRKAIEERGLTQAQVAEALGLSSSRLSQYVTGKRRPALPVAVRLAAYLGTSVEQLFCDDLPNDALGDGAQREVKSSA
ncbi:helix-turn-helix transcriptional regulator [Symbiobacterium terraclitae]|uniref:helix-turn-helix transcriptional regulator n=1 Tax=Symbiobacterium terraclitae TaxID=557451 RepID=UPI0035B53F9A